MKPNALAQTKAVYSTGARYCASAGLYAYNIILMRQQAQVARPMEIAFFMSAIMTSCFLLAAPVLLEVPPMKSQIHAMRTTLAPVRAPG